MREIKIRGYAVNELVGSQWVYGTGIHLTEFTDEYFEVTGRKEEYFVWTDSGWVEVHKKSVGQYAGQKDEIGTEAYEGDIVHLSNDEGIDYNAVIIFMDGCFCAVDGTEEDHAFRRDGLMRFDLHVNIIGNNYDNPELLEESK